MQSENAARMQTIDKEASQDERRDRGSKTGSHSASAGAGTKKMGIMDVLKESEQTAGIREKRPDPHTLRGTMFCFLVLRVWMVGNRL